MKKLKAPRLVTIVVFTTITVIFWVFYSFYNILTSTPPLKVPPELLAPISPTLDTAVLDSLQNRVFFKEGETEAFQIPLQTPTPTPQPETTTTPIPTVTISPEP